MNCYHCNNEHNGWIRESDGYGCVEWTYCVCAPTNSLTEQANVKNSNGNNSGIDPQNADTNRVASQ